MDESVKSFLETIIETSNKRRKCIERGTILWRAQLGHDWVPYEVDGVYIDDQPMPYPPTRMKPLRKEAKEGRVNPKGIPYLYLASDKETAMGEVRPWMGSLISVGAFEVINDLEIVDFSDDKYNRYYFNEPSSEEREKQVWSDIGRAFSRPITNTDSKAEYAPTQIIAEIFKMNRFDGLVFNSSLGNGRNIVLFNIDHANLLRCHLFEVKGINFMFEEATNPYFMK
jgi:RES domain-containing protein